MKVASKNQIDLFFFKKIANTSSVSYYKTFSIAHIHIDVNESKHRFINIYMNMGNAKKSYNLKRR